MNPPYLRLPILGNNEIRTLPLLDLGSIRIALAFVIGP